MFIETSAKVGHNVKLLFRRIAQSLPGMEEGGGASQDRGQSKQLGFFVIENVDDRIVIDVNINSQPTNDNQGCSC
jgi:Ras-related protein Rab-6A